MDFKNNLTCLAIQSTAYYMTLILQLNYFQLLQHNSCINTESASVVEMWGNKINKKINIEQNNHNSLLLPFIGSDTFKYSSPTGTCLSYQILRSLWLLPTSSPTDKMVKQVELMNW